MAGLVARLDALLEDAGVPTSVMHGEQMQVGLRHGGLRGLPEQPALCPCCPC
jgi:hypothetical protein